jgi:hypothetical protein
MDGELQELLKMQDQLRAMRQSCADFDKQLAERVTKFFKEQLKLESDSFSMLELVQKARSLD